MMAKRMVWSATPLAVFLFLFACEGEAPPEQSSDGGDMREAMIGTNKILLEIENQDIIDFINRYGWETRETGSGLRYYIYRQGNGPRARSGQTAVINYSVRLLTGDLVYSSEENGPRRFRIGRGGVESGLEEGIVLLRVGDRAKFILPAHLAHGLPGDGERIPQRAAIIYDVELIELID